MPSTDDWQIRSFGLGVAPPGTQGHITAKSLTGEIPQWVMKSTDKTVGGYSLGTVDTALILRPVSETIGGSELVSLGDTDATPSQFRAIIGSAAPTQAVFMYHAGKTNGAEGTANLAAGEIHAEWLRNDTTPSMRLMGQGELRLFGATSGYVGLKGAAAAGATTYQWPAADGTSGQVLSTNGGGVLSWAAAGGGGITGSLTATRIPFATGASTVIDSSALVFSATEGLQISIATVFPHGMLRTYATGSYKHWRLESPGVAEFGIGYATGVGFAIAPGSTFPHASNAGLNINGSGSVSVGSGTFTDMFNVGTAAQFRVSPDGHVATSGIYTSTFSPSFPDGMFNSRATGTLKHWRLENPGSFEFGIGLIAAVGFGLVPTSTFPSGSALGLYMNTSGNVAIGSNTFTSMFNVGSTAQFQVNGTGAVVAATGIASSGTINFSGLTASKGVFTDASKNLTSTGTLGVDQGGTGAATLTSNGVVYGNGTGAAQVTAQGGTNTVLIANAGAPSFSATPTLTSVTLTGELAAQATTPSSFSTQQDNYAIGAFSFARIQTSVTLTAITGITGGVNGKRLVLANIDGTTSITISNESASSTAANRVITGTGADYVMLANNTIELVYDATSSRWRMIN